MGKKVKEPKEEKKKDNKKILGNFIYLLFFVVF